jgi:hypothetical protein
MTHLHTHTIYSKRFWFLKHIQLGFDFVLVGICHFKRTAFCRSKKGNGTVNGIHHINYICIMDSPFPVIRPAGMEPFWGLMTAVTPPSNMTPEKYASQQPR